MDRPAKSSGDKQDAGATAENVAVKKSATTSEAALHKAAVESRQNSDALDAETTRIRRLQRQRALEAVNIRATTSEPTPNGELAENQLAVRKV